MKQKNSKLLIILLVIFILISIVAIGYIIYDKLIINKPTENIIDIEEHPSKKSSWELFVESRKNERTDSIIAEQCDTCIDIYKFELTSDGKILLTTRLEPDYAENESEIFKYDKKVIIENAILYSKVHVGMSDTCNGNERIIVVKEDGTVSYIDVDALACGHELKIEDSISNLKNIVEIYENREFVSEYEPFKYTVFAKDVDGNAIEISNLIQ